MKKYSVADIDALRRVHRNHIVYGWYDGPVSPRESRSYNSRDVTAEAEDRVRTSMIAGHTAGDLIESQRERREAAVKHERELLDLIRNRDASRAEKFEAIREFEATWAKG